MMLEYVPLLEMQRELLDIPRGAERFREYLRKMLSPDGNEPVLPPLILMNPMAREHVAKLLDDLIALGADEIATKAIEEAIPLVEDVQAELKIGLVVADDARGGWTNRFATELSLHFDSQARLERRWLSAVVWSSEIPSARSVREETLATIQRTAYVFRHGQARTLGEKSAQEGFAMALAGCETPALDLEDIEYTRGVLAPFVESEDMRTAIECLFGDAAARSLGFTPRGLSDRAGLALALHDAKRSFV